MKFIKILEIRGYPVYVQEDCKMRESIKVDIRDGLNLIERKKAEDSIPEQFKPKGKESEMDLFNKIFINKK